MSLRWFSCMGWGECSPLVLQTSFAKLYFYFYFLSSVLNIFTQKFYAGSNFVRYFVLAVIFCKQIALLFVSPYSSAVPPLSQSAAEVGSRWRQTQKAFNDNGGLSLNAWINISVKPRFGGGLRGMVLDTVCWLCHKFSFGIEVEIGLRVERSFPQQSLDVCHA